MERKKMSVDDVAQFLGYHKKYVYRLLASGAIPNRKILGRIVVYEDELNNFINNSEERNACKG